MCSPIIPFASNFGNTLFLALFIPKALHKISETPEPNVLIETGFDLVATKFSLSSQECYLLAVLRNSLFWILLPPNINH
jgi:hypothetical protein